MAGRAQLKHDPEKWTPVVMPGLVPRPSGLKLVDEAHGVDLLGHERLVSVSGHEEGSAPCGIGIACFMASWRMFRGLLFDRLVARHQADKTRLRTLSTKTQLVALLFGQLAGIASLQAVVQQFRGPCEAIVSPWGSPGEEGHPGGCQQAAPKRGVRRTVRRLGAAFTLGCVTVSVNASI